MTKPLFAVFLFLVSLNLFAQTGSEIYLADLKITETGITLSGPKNITNRKGYDNQPFFHPDKPLIYFSSFNEDGRADIKFFDFKTNQTTLFTQTPEREYSPTVTPDKKYISCIIQRDNGAQDLGKYPIGGGAPIILINNHIVGYHTWVSPSKLALFVLGEPNTLRVFDLSTGRDSIVSSAIGRALHKIPSQQKFSFVDKNSKSWTIQSFDFIKTDIITEPLPGREDLAWTYDGKIIMNDGQQFFFFDTKKKAGWKMFYVSEKSGITRIAVSPNGKKIAFVVSE